MLTFHAVEILPQSVGGGWGVGVLVTDEDANGSGYVLSTYRPSPHEGIKAVLIGLSEAVRQTLVQRG
jgi:hypothetical protein